MGPDLRELSECATRIANSPILAIKSARWDQAVLTGSLSALQTIADRLGVGREFRNLRAGVAPNTLTRMVLVPRLVHRVREIGREPTAAPVGPAVAKAPVDDEPDWGEAYSNMARIMREAGGR